MIQDIAPWKLRIEFEPCEPECGDFVFDFSREGLLLKQKEALHFPTAEEWQSLFAEDDACRLLFAFRLEHEEETGREMRFFLVLRPQTATSPPLKAGNVCPPKPYGAMAGAGLLLQASRPSTSTAGIRPAVSAGVAARLPFPATKSGALSAPNAATWNILPYRLPFWWQ